jgi:hypothetical protein
VQLNAHIPACKPFSLNRISEMFENDIRIGTAFFSQNLFKKNFWKL